MKEGRAAHPAFPSSMNDIRLEIHRSVGAYSWSYVVLPAFGFTFELCHFFADECDSRR